MSAEEKPEKKEGEEPKKVGGGGKKKRNSYEGYETYLHLVLKEACPELGTTEETTDVMNDLMTQLRLRLQKRATQLCLDNGKKTLKEKELYLAGEECFGGDTWRLAKARAEAAVMLYEKTRPKPEKKQEEEDEEAPAAAAAPPVVAS
jgi:hypothetical protein